MKSKQKILITGSLGFIASNFIRQFKFEGANYKFIGIDKAENKANINTIYKSRDYSFYLADITDDHIIDVIFDYEKPDYVVHFAASTHVDVSLNNPNQFIKNNVLGTQVIINACLKYKIKKMVYCSTDEIYGALTSENDNPWDESSVLNPLNPYSASKASGELLCKAAHNSFGLNYSISRSSNNYGHWQTSDKLIPKVIKCIMNGEKIPVYGQGLQIRDWLAVQDNCSAVMKIMEAGKNGEVYNITSNQEISNIELVQKICNIMEKGWDLIEFVNDRPGHDFRYAMVADKLKQLGWGPKIKLKDGLAETINWYIMNRYLLK